MSLEDYRTGVEIFLEKSREWENAARVADRLQTAIPSRPNLELDRRTIGWIVRQVRESPEFKNPNGGRLVLSAAAQEKWKAKVDPKIEAKIKEELKLERAALQQRAAMETRAYEEAYKTWQEALETINAIRQELSCVVDMIFEESDHLFPLLPEFSQFKGELQSSKLATRGTLCRRVIVDPDSLKADGGATLLYAKSFTGKSFGGDGFVEFALPGEINVAETFAVDGEPNDQAERKDPIILAVDHTKLIHHDSSSKITIETDNLRNKKVRIFRVA